VKWIDKGAQTSDINLDAPVLHYSALRIKAERAISAIEDRNKQLPFLQCLFHRLALKDKLIHPNEGLILTLNPYPFPQLRATGAYSDVHSKD